VGLVEGVVVKNFVIITAMVSSSFAGAQDFSKVQIQTAKVAGNVYMLTGAGGNIGVSVGKDGVLIVDDQFKELSQKIKAEIGKLSKSPVRFVINTHWHRDHVGGNEDFSNSAVIVAHENARKRMSVESFSKFFNRKTPAAPEAALPVVTFTSNMTVHFNGEAIRIVHLPAGHTDTDSMVIFETSKVAHLGDHYFSEGWPLLDLESGGSIKGYLANLETILKTLDDGYKVIPGHGATAMSVAGLKEARQAIVESAKFINEKKAAGKSLDVIKKEGLPEQWSKWGKGFISNDKWIETVFSG
jgi:cyclase